MPFRLRSIRRGDALKAAIKAQKEMENELRGEIVIISSAR
jgi:hypothetical protein